MWQKIQTWFESNSSKDIAERNIEHHLQLAVAVLLLEVSTADFESDWLEHKRISEVLSEVFDLSDDETDELMSSAKVASVEAVSLQEFTRLLNENCEHKEKVYFIEQLWRIAFADGQLDKYEDYLIRQLADLLYVPHREFLQAKHRVEKEIEVTSV